MVSNRLKSDQPILLVPEGDMRSKQQPRPSFRWPQQRGDNLTGKYTDAANARVTCLCLTF